MRRHQFRNLAVLACVALLGAAPSATVPVATTIRIAVSAAALNRYASTHALSDLQAATEGLSGTVDAYTLNAQNFGPTRRALVRAWAPVLKAVENAYDPSYDPSDPKNVPTSCVMPPPVPNATRCMSPDQVADPTLRAQYAAAVAANDQIRKSANRYGAVNRLDMEATGLFAATISTLNQIAPPGAGADFNALDGILRSTGLSENRMAKLDAILYER
jgi:hypothetical protein